MTRPFEELRDGGLLWLVNAAVFHPRGYALALVFDGDKAVGWTLVGDGSEPWMFDPLDPDLVEKFAAAERTLAAAKPEAGTP